MIYKLLVVVRSVIVRSVIRIDVDVVNSVNWKGYLVGVTVL